MIGVINLETGNLRSVMNAFSACGLDVARVDTVEQIAPCSHLVLPGVGHFKAAIEMLDAKEFRAPLRAWSESGRPLLGLCLGMQLLASSSTEGGVLPGLGLIEGEVHRIPAAPGRAVPHMGWNTLELRRTHPVFLGIKPGRDFYFAHSYTFHCRDLEDVIAVTDYDMPLTSVAARGSVLGMQFHPEKSQVNGLKLLENFGTWDGRC